MLIQQNLKISGLIIGVGLAALLAACSSHKNPLNTASPDQAARFLLQASQAAEKKLQVFSAPGGGYYGRCMSGSLQKPLCSKLYQAMTAFAATTVVFKGMTVNDLTDKKVFNKLKNDYQRHRFNAI